MAHQGDAPDALEVAEVFEQVARSLATSDDPIEVLHLIVGLAVEHLDACEYAGISMIEGRKVTSPASSNDVPRIVDRIQSEVDEGPCLDAIRERETFETDDLASETRWPKFAARANEETGVSSIVSIRLFIEGDTMGALNLYSTRRDAFNDEDVALASVFGAHAAVALSSARKQDHLERKAATRDLIGQAKGILRARGAGNDEQAFDLLRRASQRLNIKLTDVAKQIVDPAGQ